MFAPRLVLASLSGASDAEWARAGTPAAGAAVLGGIAIDEPAREAARSMVEDRDREEFLPPDPLGFIDRQLAALDDVALWPGFNVRATSVDRLRAAAAVCLAHDAFVEVNAHCRQDELCAVGCGESLLADADRLIGYVEAAASTGAVVGVKVRAEVPGVDLSSLSARLEAAGAALLHVDAMDTEPVVGEIVEATGDLFVIANNGVRDRETANEYLAMGADAVSVGRPSTDIRVLNRVRAAVEEWFEPPDARGPKSGIETR